MAPVPLAPGESILDRMVSAVRLVRDRLLRATGVLGAAGIPYAVVGGHAVAWWVARIDKGGVRITPDVNIIVPRTSMNVARDALAAAGFIPGSIAGGLLFL